jgi:hypothetical protein
MMPMTSKIFSSNCLLLMVKFVQKDFLGDGKPQRLLITVKLVLIAGAIIFRQENPSSFSKEGNTS